MSTERAARRYAASSFPEIKAVRLVPPGVSATLVNLSATGLLVECETRLLPDATPTVEFSGSFKPASVASRVIRCEVIGIATDGSLRYRVALAFSTRIPLPDDAADAPAAPPKPAISPARDKAPAATPVLRNRW